MSDAASSNKSLWVTVFAVIGGFAIFLLIILVSRTPVKPLDAVSGEVAPEEQWKLTAEGRKARLAEMRGREQSAAAGYSWVDKDAGVVQLPIDQAMRLTIDEINAKKK